MQSIFGIEVAECQIQPEIVRGRPCDFRLGAEDRRLAGIDRGIRDIVVEIERRRARTHEILIDVTGAGQIKEVVVQVHPTLIQRGTGDLHIGVIGLEDREIGAQEAPREAAVAEALRVRAIDEAVIGDR
jgi:hypothetical protein